MGALLLAIVAGLAVTLIAFLARQVLLPVLRAARRRLRRPHECRRLVEAARAELELNVERLEHASLATREWQEDGTERVFYRFGNAYSGMAVPNLPTPRRSALDELRANGRQCLGDAAGALDDAIAAIDRYDAIDLDRFREAWHGAMNPAMERMVMGDPGHQTNGANAKVVVDTDKQMAATRSALSALAAAIDLRTAASRA